MSDEIISSQQVSFETFQVLAAMKSLYKKQIWFPSEEARMNNAKVRDVYYTGSIDDYEAEIKKILDTKLDMDETDREKFPIVLLRDAMKNIGRLAMVYKFPPKRWVEINDFENEKTTEDLNNFYENININLIMKEVNEKMLLHNTEPVKIDYTFNRWGENTIQFYIHSPADVIVAANPENYFIPDVVAVKQLNSKGENIWKVETKEITRELDYGGSLISGSEQPNEYGVIRWAFARYKRGDTFWEGLNADDLINQQAYTSILKSGGVESGVFNLFPILMLLNLDKSEFKRSPRKVVSVNKLRERQGDYAPDIKAIDLHADLDKLEKFVQNYRMQTALNRNLPRSSVGLESAMPQSGYQEHLENLALMESRNNQRAAMFDFEVEVFEILKRMSAKDKNILGFVIPENAKLKIDYVEDHIEMSAIENLELWEKKINMGVATLVDFLMSENPDLSKEDAEERVFEIKEVNDRLKKKASVFDIFEAEEEGIEEEQEI